MKKRKLILYIACSVDGYIAKPIDDLSFLKCVEQEGEDYGYFDFVNQVDTVIVGRNTYQWILDQGMEYPHKDKTCFIITRTPQESIDNIHFYTRDLEELVNQIKAKPGKDIYCDGGAQVVRLLLEKQLIDELIISVIPMLLGDGKKLFDPLYPEQDLDLINSKSFSSGLVQLHYAVKR